MPLRDSQVDWIQMRGESVREGMSIDTAQAEMQRGKKGNKDRVGVENKLEL